MPLPFPSQCMHSISASTSRLCFLYISVFGYYYHRRRRRGHHHPHRCRRRRRQAMANGCSILAMLLAQISLPLLLLIKSDISAVRFTLLLVILSHSYVFQSAALFSEIVYQFVF